MCRVGILMVGVTVGLLAAPPVLAQDEDGPVSLSAHELTDNVYWVSGGTSNAGFVVGKDGVIVIDAQKEDETAEMQMAEIAAVTDLPIAAIILTHGDPDHVGGLPAYPAGIEIIEHENTRAAIRASVLDGGGGPVYSAMYANLDANFRPTIALSESRTMEIAGVEMQLLHVAPGHSSGDIAVYLPEQRVVFGGDVILTSEGPFPIIHIGGSSAGWIAAMRYMLALEADTYVSGHGPIWSREQLVEMLHGVEQRRADIAAMIEAGNSLEEINAALDPMYVNQMFPSFNETTYNELVNGYPDAVPPWANIVRRP